MINRIREMFPIFGNHEKKGQKLIYLDNAATTQKPKQVIDAISDFYSNFNATVHRGIYELSEKATEMYEATRDKVATFINASDRSEIVFTSGTTEGINFVAESWALQHLKTGDEIILTQAEHHANLVPWLRIAEKTGAKIKFIELDTENFEFKEPGENFFNKKTKLVSLVHVSNVLGNIWKDGQLESIIKRAHDVGAKVLIDAAQSVPHNKVDVQNLNPDFLVFSGHKMFGPTGVGVLYMKKELHEEVEPYKVGGSMVYSVAFDKVTWQQAPNKFEAGTPAIAQVIGLGATIDFINENINFDELRNHEEKLCVQMFEGLKSIEGIKILGNKSNLMCCGHLITFTINGVHSHDVASMLGTKGVAVRAGHHCAQPLGNLFNVESSVRASLYAYNTEEDVETFIRELGEVVKEFKSM